MSDLQFIFTMLSVQLGAAKENKDLPEDTKMMQPSLHPLCWRHGVKQKEHSSREH